MVFYNPLLYPCHQVILECSFDNLVEDVCRDELVDVSTGEGLSKWLNKMFVKGTNRKYNEDTYNYIADKPIFVPELTEL